MTNGFSVFGGREVPPPIGFGNVCEIAQAESAGNLSKLCSCSCGTYVCTSASSLNLQRFICLPLFEDIVIVVGVDEDIAESSTSSSSLSMFLLEDSLLALGEVKAI